MQLLTFSYLDSYLVIGGLRVLLMADWTLRFRLAQGSYSDIMPRLVGVFMAPLGGAVIQFLRAADPIAGKWALVSGASSGLGVEFATLLAERHANLVLVARRTDLLEQLAVRLRREHPVSVLVEGCDLSTAGSAKDLADLDRRRTDGASQAAKSGDKGAPRQLRPRAVLAPSTALGPAAGKD
jgi:short chain dehydrogenase